jgi:uncharacterized membrane protein YkvA (DUF1232 family)
MAEPKTNQPHVEEVFTHSTWKAQAEQPGTLEQLGQKWDEFIATKGQTLKTYLQDLQLAYQMLRDPDFRLERDKKITVIIALLYIISPIDLIPDAIPLLGMLDDVLVAGYALQQVAAELERYKRTRQPEGTPQTELLSNPVAADEEQAAAPAYHEAEGIPESDNADADFETSREDAHTPRKPA